jgi:hypothetical protein
LRQSYTDDATGATYTLNTQKLAFDDAEDICNDIGGHVVSYGSVSEQVAVELFYMNKASGASSWRRQCQRTLKLRTCITFVRCTAALTAVRPLLCPKYLQGLFLPSFHKDYWLGLKGSLPTSVVEVNGTSNRTWAWIDGVTGPPGQGKNYVHWGSWVFKKVVVSKEPNNWFLNESCAAANASLIYSNAYGWSDVECGGNRTSICKTMREQSTQLLSCHLVPRHHYTPALAV